MAKLDNRIRKLEARFQPKTLRATVESFVDDQSTYPVTCDSPGLPENHPRVLKGLEDGEALLSRWWTVTFFDGTPEQQENRLNELKAIPRFQRPCRPGEEPVVNFGGARMEDTIRRLEQKRWELRTKRSGASD